MEKLPKIKHFIAIITEWAKWQTQYILLGHCCKEKFLILLKNDQWLTAILPSGLEYYMYINFRDLHEN